MSKKEELRRTIADLIYARVGWSNASEGSSVDIVDYILQREKAMLDEVERPLLKGTSNPLAYSDGITEALSTISKLRGKG